MSSPNVLVSSDYGPIIINIHDSFIGRSICAAGYWAGDDINLIKQLLSFLLTKKSSVTFYDVGANIGTHSLAIAKTFQEKVTVRAFEAQRQVFNMLCGTVALNGLSNVYCYNVAVNDGSTKTITISLPNYSGPNNFGGLELIPPLRSDNQEMKTNSVEDVAALALDEFDESVDFIKMDIEGMEDKALAGARTMLEKHRPICFVEILKTDIDFVVEAFKALRYSGFQKGADLVVVPEEYGLKIDGINQVF